MEKRPDVPKPRLQGQAVERVIEVGGTKIHIRSIFGEQTSLDEALKKIIDRRLSKGNN